MFRFNRIYNTTNNNDDNNHNRHISAPVVFPNTCNEYMGHFGEYFAMTKFIGTRSLIHPHSNTITNQ